MKRKGAVFGLISGFTWALDTVIIGVVLAHSVFIQSEHIIFIAPLISTFLHDLFSAFWLSIYLFIRGELKTALSHLTSRDGRIILLGGLLGGPVGMTFYILSIKYLNASFAASFSAVYPAVGALFAFILLKDRLSLKNWIGLITSITFIILLSYTGGEEQTSLNFGIGLLFVFLTIFGWGMESTVVAYGMKDEEITPEQSILLRQLVSACTYGIIILPFIKGSYSLVGEVIFSTEILYILLISIAGSISYLCYYKAINLIGPTKAMGLNISYSAWAILLNFLITGTPVTFKLMLFQCHDHFWFGHDQCG